MNLSPKTFPWHQRLESIGIFVDRDFEVEEEEEYEESSRNSSTSLDRIAETVEAACQTNGIVETESPRVEMVMKEKGSTRPLNDTGTTHIPRVEMDAAELRAYENQLIDWYTVFSRSCRDANFFVTSQRYIRAMIAKSDCNQ